MLYLFFGLGGNIAVSIGDDGVLIVDDQIPSLIPKIKEFHSPNSNFYNFFANIAKVSSYNLFGPNHKNDEKINFGGLGDLIFPYFNMGSINSTHLFGLDE